MRVLHDGGRGEQYCMHTTLWGHSRGQVGGVGSDESLLWDGDTTAFLDIGTFPFVRVCMRLCVTLACVCLCVSEYEYVHSSATQGT